MILCLILNLVVGLLNVLISLIPTIETPLWITTNLPTIVQTIAGFNHYLPVTEGVSVILGLIGITLSWKIVQIFISPFLKL